MQKSYAFRTVIQLTLDNPGQAGSLPKTKGNCSENEGKLPFAVWMKHSYASVF
jgi:hypothetical protein